MTPLPVRRSANDALGARSVSRRVDPLMRVVVAGGSGLIGRALVASLVRDGVSVDVLSRDPGSRGRHVPGGARVLGWDPSDRADRPRARPDPRRCRRRRQRERRAGRALAVDAVAAAGDRREPRRDERPPRRGDGLARSGRAAASLRRRCRNRRLHRARRGAGDGGDRRLRARPASSSSSAATGKPPRNVPGRSASASSRSERPSSSPGTAASCSLLALPVRLGLGGRYGSGEQWFSWIHLDDLVAVYRRAIDDVTIDGPVNAAGPDPRRAARGRRRSWPASSTARAGCRSPAGSCASSCAARPRSSSARAGSARPPPRCRLPLQPPRPRGCAARRARQTRVGLAQARSDARRR